MSKPPPPPPRAPRLLPNPTFGICNEPLVVDGVIVGYCGLRARSEREVSRLNPWLRPGHAGKPHAVTWWTA
jgi:hypothetical protein